MRTPVGVAVGVADTVEAEARLGVKEELESEAEAGATS